MTCLKLSGVISFLGLCLCAQPVLADVWVNIGPAPIDGSPYGDISGRINSIAVDPSNSEHWLIGAANGGVWGTSDGGMTWTPLTDDQASLAMGVVTFAPSNADIIYAGTGQATGEAGGYAGAGLLKSTDGGKTWQLLAASTFARTSFTSIKVDPVNPTIVVATTTQGSAGTAFGLPVSEVPPRGIFKSTDGGVTWSRKGPTLSIDSLGRLIGDGTALAADPTNFEQQYAGIGTTFGAATNGVYRSMDAGETWTLVNGPWSSLAGAGRVALAIAPSNSNILYVSIQDVILGVPDGGLLGLWRTGNAWAAQPTWTTIPTGALPFNGSPCQNSARCGSDLLGMIVDPSDPNTLYTSGVVSWKCTNCGASPTWTPVTDGSLPLGIHPDVRSEAWAGSRLILGTDGGLYSTSDGGTTWENHNTNLSITQFTGGCIHPTDANGALGGSADNLYQKWSGSNAWQYVPETGLVIGDGRNCAFSSANPDTDWVLGLERTLDGGVSFTPFGTPGIDFSLPGVPIFSPFGPVEKCPAADVLIGANSTLWRTDNFFSALNPSWSANSPPTEPISALAFAPRDTTCSTYAFGTQAGNLRLTSNGGATWVDLDVGNAVPNRYVGSLAFDPTNSNTLYVTLSGFDEDTPDQAGHVFKTTSALSGFPVWSNVSPPANLPHNTIAVDTLDPNIVYVGTDRGVWKSTDGAGTWIHMGPESGMPNVAVYDLRINDMTNRVIAFTHGRGAFALPATVTGQKTFSIGPSSMEGRLLIMPGDFIAGGYSFKFKNRQHIATSYLVTAKVTLDVTCPFGGGPGGTITIDLGTKTYAVPAAKTDWLPTSHPNGALSWQGSTTATDLCGGNKMENKVGAVFTATTFQNPPTGSRVDFRFKYRDPNAKGKGNVDCLNSSDPRRNRADVCGARWSKKATEP